ncbi:MAG: peptidase M66 [Burkholderiales bacterium]|nr:MAG: peptidase M66 [Burkholderiales bacterium]
MNKFSKKSWILKQHTTALIVLTLSACGGGSNTSNSTASTGQNSASGSSSNSTGLDVLPALSYTRLEYAQTHVVPETGKLDWSITSNILGTVPTTAQLHLTAGRDTLLMVALSGSNPAPVNPKVEVMLGTTSLGIYMLNSPSQLPVTESNGPAYSNVQHSVTLPASVVQPGIAVQFSADNYVVSPPSKPKVGLDSTMDLFVLPFYLFGATDANSYPLSVTSTPTSSVLDQTYAQWPIAKLNFINHPAKRVDWPYIVVAPRNGNAAYRLANSSQQLDGFDGMSAVLNAMGGIRSANGDAPTNNQYYAPLLMLDAAGKFAWPGGGLGGGNIGTGDHLYQGIFIHEQGHAFGMPHADSDYSSGTYPYVGGSLLGSSWGYDSVRKILRPTYLRDDLQNTAGCRTGDFPRGRQRDSSGRCIKQDPMQSGAGDQAAGDYYTMFSDYNAARIQRYFEGVTTLDAANKPIYSGGKIFVDAKSPTGYSRWNSLTSSRDTYTPTTENKGAYGLNASLPTQRKVPVHAIVVTYSGAGTANVSQVYPPISYQGNLLSYIDPTDAAQRASIVPNTGALPWFCVWGGCDYTVRVTYADNSTSHVLLQGGFREGYRPMDPISNPNATDPSKSDSFKTWAINVPGGKAIQKIELLDTPMAWKGMPANPPVLVSR